MKKLLLIILLTLLLASLGCEKEPVVSSSTSILPPPQPPPSPASNTPPKVSAGANIELALPVDSAILTGAVLTTDSKIKSYKWEKFSGPAAFKIDHQDSLITKVRALQEGTYIFQLTVTDSSGLTGKAAVTINVITIAAFEYNLDLNVLTGYKFFDNAEICPWDCYYADQTTITASVQLPPTHNLQVYIQEETDSAAHVNKLNYGFTAFRLSNQLYASGTSSFDFKKVLQQGGGTFSGTVHLNSSSAIGTSREDAFKALPPLTVSGKLDTTTLTINMQIKGKIIF